MVEEKVYSYLGLAQKARKVISGQNTIADIRDISKFQVILIAEDASLSIKNKFSNKAIQNNIRYFVFGSKYDLGVAIGKSPRTVLGVADKKIAIEIMKLLENNS